MLEGGRENTKLIATDSTVYSFEYKVVFRKALLLTGVGRMPQYHSCPRSTWSGTSAFQGKQVCQGAVTSTLIPQTGVSSVPQTL